MNDEYEREKKKMHKEKEDMEAEIRNIKSFKAVSEVLENTSNKHHWASGIRQNMSVEEQAQLFYESFRI